MNNDPMLLPQQGYVLPTPFSPYPPTAGLGPFAIMQPPNVFSPPSLIHNPNSTSDYYARFSRLPSSTSISSDMSVATEKDLTIITWEDLKRLLPEVPADGRGESGLLPDGKAYAQKTARRDHYFLFPSKSAYIMYFTHYYFSTENLDRDKTMRGMMTESAGVPIEKIIEAPRLASIGTTVDDMKKAIETNSNVLCTVNMPDGLCLVKRKDGYPASNATAAFPYPRTRNSMDSSVNSLVFGEHPPTSPANTTEAPSLREDAPPPSVPVPVAPTAVTTVYATAATSPAQFTDNSSMYQPHQPHAFIRPARPVTSATINSMVAAIAAMGFGQTPLPPQAAAANHLFGHLPPQNQLAATLAVLNPRGTTIALANQINQHYAAAAQGRGGQPQAGPPPPHSAQQQLYHHHTHHNLHRNRTTPPPPPQQAAGFYQFPPPPPPFYPFPHHPHEATPPQFAAAYQQQHYDQWGADAAGAALAATGIQLQYAPPPPPPAQQPVMVWPTHAAAPPQSLRGQAGVVTVSASASQPVSSSQLLPVQTQPPVATAAAEASVHPCAKDDPSIVAVTDPAAVVSNESATPSKKVTPVQPQSRPNSGGGPGKGGKYKATKGGAPSHQRQHVANRSPPSAVVATKEPRPSSAATPAAAASTDE